jgi:hypothetical protein
VTGRAAGAASGAPIKSPDSEQLNVFNESVRERDSIPIAIALAFDTSGTLPVTPGTEARHFRNGPTDVSGTLARHFGNHAQQHSLFISITYAFFVTA